MTEVRNDFEARLLNAADEVERLASETTALAVRAMLFSAVGLLDEASNLLDPGPTTFTAAELQQKRHRTWPHRLRTSGETLKMMEHHLLGRKQIPCFEVAELIERSRETAAQYMRLFSIRFPQYLLVDGQLLLKDDWAPRPLAKGKGETP